MSSISQVLSTKHFAHKQKTVSHADFIILHFLCDECHRTVRLLKAFQIEFSWYRLSSWINLTEQWPLRASLIVLEHDASGDLIDDSTSLQSLYDKVRSKISHLREAAPLLELDRDERKLEAFLQLHKHDLLVADLRIFLPFTINLDPYLRKVLKGNPSIQWINSTQIHTHTHTNVDVHE